MVPPNCGKPLPNTDSSFSKLQSINLALVWERRFLMPYASCSIFSSTTYPIYGKPRAIAVLIVQRRNIDLPSCLGWDQ